MAPKEKPKVYTFLYRGGNMTLVLAGSRYDVQRNALGDPIGRRLVQSKRIVFQNGFGTTNDPDVVELLQQHHEFGKDITWHPTCAPKEEMEEVKVLAQSIEEALKVRDRRKQKGIEAALEGGVARE